DEVIVNFQQRDDHINGIHKLRADYLLEMSYPVELVAININGENIPASGIINSASVMLLYLNSLNKGTFINKGGIIKSINNPNIFSTITFEQFGEGQTTQFQQENYRISSTEQDEFYLAFPDPTILEPGDVLPIELPNGFYSY